LDDDLLADQTQPKDPRDQEQRNEEEQTLLDQVNVDFDNPSIQLRITGPDKKSPLHLDKAMPHLCDQI